MSITRARNFVGCFAHVALLAWAPLSCAPANDSSTSRAALSRAPKRIMNAVPEVSSLTVDVDEPRTFLVSLPHVEDATRSAALPVVFVFHGGGGSAESMRAYADLESRAHAPAIFVYPSAGVAHVWADEYALHWDATRDVAFFDAMLAKIAKSRRIDKVYALGLSSGAYFVNQLACERAPKLAGIVAIEGGGPFGECSGKVSAMIVHDAVDPVVQASEGASSLAEWLTNDQCKSPAKTLDNACTIHECGEGSRVVSCAAHGGVHAIEQGVRERALAFMNL